MSLIQKVSLRVCEKIIQKLCSSEETVLNYSATLNQNKEESVELYVITNENEFKFVLRLPEKEPNNVVFDKYPIFYIEEEDITVEIRDISINGYNSMKFEKVDVSHLKLILKTLACNHSRHIKELYLDKIFEQLGHANITRDFDINDVKDILLIIKMYHLENADDLKPAKLLDGIEKLISHDVAQNNLSENYLYIKGNIIEKKLFIRSTKGHTRKLKILDTGPENLTPLVYDVLLTIFCFSDQQLRQHHFHELLDYYYDVLKNILSNFSLDLTNMLPVKEYQKLIYMFTPYVKLKILKHFRTFLKDFNITLVDGNKNLKLFDMTRDSIWTSIIEMNECVLYSGLTREDCYEIVRNKIGSSDYKFVNYKLIPLEERNGFLGEYFKLKINIIQNGEEKLLNLFAKYLPTAFGFTRDLALISFKKEEFYYRKFIPELISLGLKDISDFLPQCYFSRTNDVLVFEDLSEMSYGSLSATVPLTYDLAQTVIKQLAKIHACSLLYEEIMSKRTNETVRLGNKYEEFTEEMFFQVSTETQMKKTIDCSMHTVLKMMEFFPDVPKKFTVEEFKKKAEIMFNLSYEKIKKSDEFRNVLCHGDCWTSNILFKIIGNTPVECCIVDYQLTRYCPPCHDLFFFLYVAIDKESRTKYMSKLLREYYLELTNIFKKYNFNLNTIFSYDQFLVSCNYMKPPSIFHAALVLQIMLYPKEKMDDILKDGEKANHLFTVERKEFL